MAFIKKEEKQITSTKNKSELFEKFMIEIRQYTKNGDGSIFLTGPYMSMKDATEKFKDWLKKNNY